MPYIDWHGNEIEDGEEDAVARDNAAAFRAETEAGRTRVVEAGLALDAHAYYYRVRLDPAEARSFARLEPDADGTLAVLLDAIDQAIPVMDFGPDNLNTGKPAHTYEVGREYSRVVYLDWPRSYAPDGFDWPALESRLREIAEDAGADEHGPEEDGPFGFRYRFWWD